MKIFLNILIILNILFAQDINVYASVSTEEVEKKISNISLNFVSDENLRYVLSNQYLFNIYKYLERNEIINIRNTNKFFYNFVDEHPYIWREQYIDYLKINSLTSIKDYKNLVYNYHRPSINFLKKDEAFKWFMPESLNDNNTLLGSVKDQNSKLIAAKIKNDKLERLGLLNDGRWSRALGANFDTSVIVGCATDGANNNVPTAFKYRNNGKLESLGLLNEGNSSRAFRVNDNGTEIIGIANDGSNKNRPRLVKWINGSLKVLDDTINEDYLHITNINFDGSVIVGFSTDKNKPNTEKAFRRIKGIVYPLSSLKAGGGATRALSTNFDGSIIAGWANDGTKNNKQAVIWDKENNIYSLNFYFERLNLISFPRILASANIISDDGSKIIGNTHEIKEKKAQEFEDIFTAKIRFFIN